MTESNQNYIQVYTKEDHSAVILTTVIEGKELSWITYNAKQLDELIRLLTAHHNELIG